MVKQWIEAWSSDGPGTQAGFVVNSLSQDERTGQLRLETSQPVYLTECDRHTASMHTIYQIATGALLRRISEDIEQAMECVDFLRDRLLSKEAKYDR